MLRETIFASTSLKSLYLLSSLFFTFCTSKFFLGTAAFVLLSLCFCFLQTQTCVKRYYPSGPSIVSLITPGPVHDFVRDPREFTNSLQTLTATYGEVLSLWIGLTRAAVTEVPADIVHISSDPVTFPRASKLKDAFGLITPGGLFCMDKSQHCITRRKLRDKFNHKMLYSFQNAMSVATGELQTYLHEAASAREPVNICNLISATTFSIILNVAFGIEMDYEERIRFSNDVTLLTEELMQECFRWPIRQALVYLGSRKKMMECKERINAFCRRFIDERRQERSSQKASREPDLLDAILDLEGHSEEALLSIVLEFAMGGYHTTTQLLVWCLYEICCSPQVESRIHTELEKNLGHVCGHRTLSEDDVNRLPYLKSVWKESMRMHPPVAIILRAAATDVTLRGSGVRLPKGTHIYGNTRGLHRSSAIWADSNSFLPERWGSGRGASGAERVPAGSFVPFGIGQWNCAGRFLADYEGILILAEMHRQFKFTLACSPCDVKNYSLTVDSARFLDTGSGLDKHVPMYVELRGHSSDLSPGKV